MNDSLRYKEEMEIDEIKERYYNQINEIKKITIRI